MIRLRGFSEQAASPPSSYEVTPLHTSGQLRRIMDRERMRCDRGHSTFCLVTFNFPSCLNVVDQNALASICHQRLRLTDDAGLLTSTRLGIILPETEDHGARIVAEHIIALLPPTMREVRYDVYSYPQTTRPLDRPSVKRQDGRDDDLRQNRAADHLLRADVPTTANGVHSMQSLFTCRLPTWKRAMDVACSSTALLVGLPVLLLVALLIKMTSRGPIFYRQQRDGQAGRRFWIYKFRTMVVNADDLKAQLRSINEQDGPAFKLKNDPRVTPIGRFLRRTCLDEVPQLLNVLKGDMSLVGPRPMCSKEAKECSQWQRRRLDVTPGLTCLWQIRGGTKTTFADWMRMDLRYISSRSFARDVLLIALTIPAIIRRDGVY